MVTLLVWATILSQTPVVSTIDQHYTQVTQREQLLSEVDRIPTQWVDSTYPDWFAPDLLLVNQDINHWIDILPYSEDKSHTRYVVAPLQWAIVPVITVTGEDQEDVLNWWDIDIMSYLENGALHHPWTRWPREQSGNYVLAGHTSYYSYQNGRYKTAMQFIALMQSWDPLRMFDQQANGEWKKYDFSITKSFETVPEDISILEQPIDWNMLTVYGCYPFGSLDRRRVIQWEISS